MPVLSFSINGVQQLAIEIDRYIGRVKDVEPVWQAVADRMAEVWGREFRLEGAFVRWAPLSPKYRQWKAKHYPGAKILHLSGDLEDSLTRRPFGIEHIDSKIMVIGTQVFYANYHQQGTPNMPARPPLRPIRRGDAKMFGKFLHQHIVLGKISSGTK